MEKTLKVIAGAPDRPLRIGDIEIPAYVLEGAHRVLSQRGLQSGIGMGTGGSTNISGAPRIASFVKSLEDKGIQIKDLAARIASPIRFQPPGGGRTAYGYPAIILVDICNAILAARDVSVLQKQQAHIAERADILIRGLATVGIIALVDEVTGYQEVRDRNALHAFLDKFLLKEHATWSKRFPDEFYQEIFRLKNWKWKGMKVNRPQVVGHYTNDLVWDRIAPALRDELERRNPKGKSGDRPARHHQWLTHEVGHPELQKHLIGVIALMKSVQTAHGWDECKRRIQRVYPKPFENLSVLPDE